MLNLAYLDAVLQTVELQCPTLAVRGPWAPEISRCAPCSCCRPLGIMTDLPAAVCDLATGLANCTRLWSVWGAEARRGEEWAVKTRSGGAGARDVPFKLITSRMLAVICARMWFEGVS
jgi:hypothetical protein